MRIRDGTNEMIQVLLFDDDVRELDRLAFGYRITMRGVETSCAYARRRD